MEELPTDRTPNLSARAARTAALWAALALFVGAPAARAQESAPALAATPAQGVDLIGTWHVLVHYTDADAHDPDQLRWEDRIWVFEPASNRLKWTEYPIVVFGSEKNRFEQRSTNRQARVIGAWEPDEAQLADIQQGLRINSRGMKRKNLRGSDDAGWHSSGGSQAVSASVLTYEEIWSVEGLPAAPVFLQLDSMGSVGSEMLEGATRYETTSIEPGGAVLRGRYARDENRRGTFVMRRSGATRALEERTQSELHQRAFRRTWANSSEARSELRAEIGKMLAAQGRTLSEPEIEALLDEILTAVADEGLGPEALRLRLQERLQTPLPPASELLPPESGAR